MSSSPNATSYVPPSTDISVYPIGPTQNRSVSPLKRVTNALLQPWSRARDHGGRQAHTERPILPGACNQPSQTSGIPEYSSSTATALSTSEGPPTTTGSHKSSPSTCARSTRRPTQSHQGFDHCDPGSMRCEGARLPGGLGREESGDKKMEGKKMRKGPKFSKRKGRL